MKEYRWENKDNYIAIESVKPMGTDEFVYMVDSSVHFSELPVEFRDKVPHSSSSECEDLVEQVKFWAEKNGYKSVGTI